MAKGNGKDVLVRLIATVEELHGQVVEEGQLIKELKRNQVRMQKAVGRMAIAAGDLSRAVKSMRCLAPQCQPRPH